MSAYILPYGFNKEVHTGFIPFDQAYRILYLGEEKGSGTQQKLQEYIDQSCDHLWGPLLAETLHYIAKTSKEIQSPPYIEGQTDGLFRKTLLGFLVKDVPKSEVMARLIMAYLAPIIVRMGAFPVTSEGLTYLSKRAKWVGENYPMPQGFVFVDLIPLVFAVGCDEVSDFTHSFYTN